METLVKPTITVEATIQATLKAVWTHWTSPGSIVKWNSASPDWHTPEAEHELKQGGRFRYRMEAKDGSTGFDFTGTFDDVRPHELLTYTMDDGRKVAISFAQVGQETHISESFEAEDTHSLDQQREGWQSILNNFKTFVEKKHRLVKFNFDIFIQAPPEKVYTAMLSKEHYTEWTEAFCPGSYFEGSWEKGSEIKFLALHENGEAMGMRGHIKENIPGKFVSINYDGVVGSGMESEAEAWSEAYENYSYDEENGGTRLTVELTGTEEYQEFFSSAWPLALNKLKQICEQ